MESIKGKCSLSIDGAMLQARLHGYAQRLVDLGAGDGRYVQHVARQCPGDFAIGIDACRENLAATSAKAAENTLYLIANACALPNELHRVATHLTINFPWGSLLEGLLDDDLELHQGILLLGQLDTRLDIRLNGGALAEAGWSLEEGVACVGTLLQRCGFEMKRPVVMDACALRQVPTTWAKRLAFGRDPRAALLSGVQRREYEALES
jgi:hypothetical protein